jgi:purine-cytosine permease-like protein
MVTALQVGVWGGILIVMATLTTNFVNIYMSALALRSLWPATADRTAIWIIGGIGSAISALSSAWLDQMANFTIVLAGAFVPVGGLLLAHFVFDRRGSAAVSVVSVDPGHPVDPDPGERIFPASTDALYYGPRGEPPAIGLWRPPGLLAWAAGAVIYYVALPIGGTLPGLAVSIATYLVLIRRS